MNAKKVAIWVEGESDVLAMKALLEKLIESKRQNGVSIDFFQTSDGNRKRQLILAAPERAARFLSKNPYGYAVILPDLHPINVPKPHQTPAELEQVILGEFETALHQKNYIIQDYRERFRVFCFKYDLEALVLAAEESLASHLEAHPLKIDWVKPVEDQNKDRPPKRVVEELFKTYHKKYQPIDTADILQNANYQTIAQRCPQCFAPFVQYLESL